MGLLQCVLKHTLLLPANHVAEHNLVCLELFNFSFNSSIFILEKVSTLRIVLTEG